MNRHSSKVLLYSILVLGISISRLSGLTGILDSRVTGASSDPNSGRDQAAYAQAALATPTATASATPTPTIEIEPTRILTSVPINPTASPIPDMYAFIQAPAGPLELPYVNLIGFQTGSYSSQLRISGTLNENSFNCDGSPCTLPLPAGSSRVIFQAYSPSGLPSQSVIANVRVEGRPGRYFVTIESVSEYFGVARDACMSGWEVEDDTNPAWAEFPRFPYELNTKVTLHTLAARLIVQGIVNVQDCPSGGMSHDLDWPNGCGLERATNKMIEWQNQYDDAIWMASIQIGIPPRILKTLIQVESQFWPGNERFYVDEYGLGQINQLGVDVLLRRNPILYQQVCSSVLTYCNAPYASLPPDQQRMIRGALMISQNSTCPTCTHGVDLTKSKQGIPFIAQVLKANCEQVEVIMDKYGETTDYESYWKFTLFAYHSGVSCFEDAVRAVKQNDIKLNWTNLSDMTNCTDGKKYVNGLWGSLLLFDAYRYTPGAEQVALFSPVFMPTRTPPPPPTPVLSQAQVWVLVFMDNNGDGIPQENEWLSGIPVELGFQYRAPIRQVTSQGPLKFDLTGFQVGTQIVASLPGLYRSYTFYLPDKGIVPVVFIFSPPVLPTNLP